MSRVCVVTGGSSGIGREITKILSDKGFSVYEISRSGYSNHKAQHVYADVTDEETVKEAIAEIISKERRINLLINCAGFGISGAIEFTELEDARRQFDVNFFGMVNVCKAVIPHMREKKGGRIVNISSLAAVVPIPFQAFYSASKAAIDTYTCALANEVKSFGISVCAVLPGDIATGFTANRKKSVEGNDIYHDMILKSVGKMENDEQKGMSAKTAAKLIVKIALRERVKPLYSIGFTNKAISVLAKVFPMSFVNFIVRKMYL